MTNFDDAIGYCLSQYTSREDASLQENCDAVLELWAAGVEAFSPIALTDPIERRRKERNELLKANAYLKGIDVNESKFAFVPDYLAHDFRYIKRWMNRDGGYKCCVCHNPVSTKAYTSLSECNCVSKVDTRVMHYDSGVFGIVLPSAAPTTAYLREANIQYKTEIPLDIRHESWYSNGVTDEYLLCKTNHLLVITKATALTVPRAHWEDYAL